MICDLGDVVIVPFPFVDTAAEKRRPSVVLSREAFNEINGHSICAHDHHGRPDKLAKRYRDRRSRRSGLRAMRSPLESLHSAECIVLKRVGESRQRIREQGFDRTRAMIR